jgi:putative hydrolase of the HAD superfamily
MVDVDGVLVRGRPSDGRTWKTELEIDLGLHPEDLTQEFFAPHWNDIVTGRASLLECLKPALTKIAPHLSYDDVISYWFSQDSRLDTNLIAALALYRSGGLSIYLATNQEHQRAKYLMDTLGLSQHVDGIYYSAAMGCQKPEAAFFEKVASHSGFAPSELLLIDDQSVNISAAKLSGWNAIHWSGECTLANKLADFAEDLTGNSPRE